MSDRVHPLWTVVLPLVALTALIAAPPERRLYSALVSASLCALLQWLLPKARFHARHYFSPVNVALLLLTTKLVAVPALLMTIGYRNEILALPASVSGMNGAILIDTVAYVAFCLGLQFAPTGQGGASRFSPLPLLSQPLARGFVLAFAGIGLLGLYFTFGTPARFVEYFSEPAILQPEAETWTAFFGTVLRPFLAFSLASWWSRVADGSRDQGTIWRPVAVGIVAAAGITIANLTFSFNRGAFVFPVISLVAVHSARIRRIPPMASFGALVSFVPVLMFLGEYRSAAPPGVVQPAKPEGLQESLASLGENILVYAGGPQLTSLWYENREWGQRLYGGYSLIASAMSPIPILGKGFRDAAGPEVYNQAIYGITGIADQIPPFPAELFVNFHALGVLAGFLCLGMLLARSQLWLDNVGSTFGAFAIQYVATWAATLCVWSLSVYVQILFYFMGPLYLYFAVTHARAWLRTSAARGVPLYSGAAAR